MHWAPPVCHPNRFLRNLSENSLKSNQSAWKSIIFPIQFHRLTYMAWRVGIRREILPFRNFIHPKARDRSFECSRWLISFPARHDSVIILFNVFMLFRLRRTIVYSNGLSPWNWFFKSDRLRLGPILMSMINGAQRAMKAKLLSIGQWSSLAESPRCQRFSIRCPRHTRIT